ncbi:hypothetical protein HY479_03245 [Candidatus Uhrbacteria bacterium]|nr:hypothetical protein [Candidatus Uhrbacteria bacterium]
MGTLTKQLARACDLTVIACSDFRHSIDAALLTRLQTVFGPHVTYDLISVPGACHRLVRQSPVHREIMLADLDMLVDLHQPETIVIVQHEECGRYQDVLTSVDRIQEQRILSDDIQVSEQILRQRFPNLTVLGFIARMDGQHLYDLDKVWNGGAVGNPEPPATTRVRSGH